MFKELQENMFFTEAWDTVDEIFENIDIGYRLLGTVLVVLAMAVYALTRTYLWKIWRKDFSPMSDEDIKFGCEFATGKKDGGGHWQKKNKYFWLSLCILSFIFPVFWKIFSVVDIVLIIIGVTLYVCFGIVSRLKFLHEPLGRLIDLIHKKVGK